MTSRVEREKSCQSYQSPVAIEHGRAFGLQRTSTDIFNQYELAREVQRLVSDEVKLLGTIWNLSHAMWEALLLTWSW